MHEYRELLPAGALALERSKLSRLLSIHARALSHRPPHTFSPRPLAPPRVSPGPRQSPRRVFAEWSQIQRHAAASASAAAFAGKPFPTNASLAALAHASYAATSAPHRSVSAAFSS